MAAIDDIKKYVTDSDEEIDAAIAQVGSKIEGHRKRLTVYYMLAEKYGNLSVLGG